MALADALQAWDEAWSATGAPIEELIAPGIGPDQVRAALGRENVHPDVLTWFGWHNGPGRTIWYAAPSGRWLADIEQMAEALAEDRAEIAPAERGAMVALAAHMSMGDDVATTLTGCPDRA
jgi:hypothetical protein